MIKNEKGFLSLLGLLGLILALAVTCYLVYLVLNAYIDRSFVGRAVEDSNKRGSQINTDRDINRKSVDDIFLEQGIDRSNPKAAIESTVNKFKDVQEERLKQLEEVEKSFKQ